MVAIVIAVLLLILTLYLLFLPIRLVINTDEDLYVIQATRLMRASLTAHPEELLVVKFYVLGFKFNYLPLQNTSWAQAKKLNSEGGSESRFSQKLFKIQTLKRLCTSFKIKRFYLNIDSGNCITNAKLYPIFSLLNFYKGGFHLNFIGKNTLILVIENKPIRIIKSFINL